MCDKLAATDGGGGEQPFMALGLRGHHRGTDTLFQEFRVGSVANGTDSISAPYPIGCGWFHSAAQSMLALMGLTDCRWQRSDWIHPELVRGCRQIRLDRQWDNGERLVLPSLPPTLGMVPRFRIVALSPILVGRACPALV